MSLWSPTGPQWKTPLGIFWRAVAWTNITGAAKKPVASFTSKTGYPATFSATAKKPAAGMTAVMEPRAQIQAALQVKPMASLSGVMEPKGTFAAQLAKATAFLQQSDQAQIVAQLPKPTAALTAKETEKANIAALLNKATAAINAKQKQAATISATGLKASASLIGRAPVPPVLYADGNSYSGSSTNTSFTLNVPNDPTNAVVVLVALNTGSTSGNVTATCAGTNIPQLGSYMNLWSFTSFGQTYHGDMFVLGLQNAPAGATQSIAFTTTGSGTQITTIFALSLTGVGSFVTPILKATASSSTPDQSVALAGGQMGIHAVSNGTSSGSSSFSSPSQTQDYAQSFGTTNTPLFVQHSVTPVQGANTDFSVHMSNSTTWGSALLVVNGV